jgi:predicted ATPase/DNA-binding SARP family transcriptional activator
METLAWTLDLFGGLRARYADQDELIFPSRYSRKLLAYLAIYPQPRERSEIAAVLWADHTHDAARRNLRTELSRLQRALPRAEAPPLLNADRHTVGLAREHVRTDVALWETYLRTAQRAQSTAQRVEALTAAVQLYRGPLIADLELEPLDQKRREYADSFVEALLALSANWREMGDLRAAIEFARRATLADPLREDAHSLLIELLARCGRIAEARACYRSLASILRREFGGKPKGKIRQLLRSASSSRTTYSPARPGDAVPSFHPLVPRLPLPADRFYGREAELARLQQLLCPGPPAAAAAQDAAALVTLVAPAGFGKTRLALETAHRVAGHFENAVWFVPLAEFAAPSDLAATIRHALDLPPTADTDPLDQLTLYFQQRRCLLVLDNVEHVLTEAKQLLAVLRARAHTLTLLLTSLRPPGIPGETVVSLSSLPLPTESADLSALRSNPCAALFENRARMVQARFTVTRRSAQAVAEICRYLEGIPLAIEIAAGRCTSWAPAEILQQLRDHATTLRNHNPSAPRRHRTLAAAISGSYETLPSHLQALFTGLSGFSGGGDMAAVRAICDADDVEADLNALVEQSLVQIDIRTDTPRYRLLRVMHDFAASRLSPTQRARLAERHAAYFLELAERVVPLLHSADGAQRMQQLLAEHENLHAALNGCSASGQADRLLRLAVALGEFWRIHGALREGRRWLQIALALNPEPTGLRAAALCALGALCIDNAAARAAYDEALNLYRAQEDQPGIGIALLGLGGLDECLDLDLRTVLEQSLAMLQQAGDWRRCGEAYRLLAAKEAVEGNVEAALALYDRALSAFQRVEDRHGIARVLMDQGNTMNVHYEGRNAAPYLTEALAIVRELGNRRQLLTILEMLASTSRGPDDHERLETLCAESEYLAREMGIAYPTSVSIRAHCMFLRGDLDKSWEIFTKIREARLAVNAPLRVKLAEARLALVAVYRGDLTTARALGEACLSFFRGMSFKLNIAETLMTLGRVALRAGDLDQAVAAFLEALPLYEELNVKYGPPDGLEGWPMCRSRGASGR